MRQALRQADYTVKDEQKVDGGYYLEVEIDPIVNFSGLEDTISQLRTEAEEEATLANSSSSQDEDSYGSGDGTYGYDDGSYGDGYDDSYGDGYGDSYDSYSDGDPYGSYSGEDSSSSDGEETSQADSEPGGRQLPVCGQGGGILPGGAFQHPLRQRAGDHRPGYPPD